MPIKAFFKFYEEGIKQEAAKFREQLDIALVPRQKFEYYTYMRDKYNSIIYTEKPKLPEAPPDMYIDAASEDAKTVMFNVFKTLKRGYGYGG
jgi:hypothetical protein